MKQKLLKIFKKNLTEIFLSRENKNIKIGAYFEDIPELQDDIRYKYLKNLVSINPIQFDIPESTDMIQKLIMMQSFNETSFLQNNQLIDHSIIGVLTENSDIPILFVDVKNPQNISETYPFSVRNRSCNFKVNPLNLAEQVCLSLHMINIYKTEKVLYTKKIRVLAYLDRLMFKENVKHGLLNILYEYYYSLVTDTYEGLEKILENIEASNLNENTKSSNLNDRSRNLDQNIELNNLNDMFRNVDQNIELNNLTDICNFPLVLRRDLELQLALIYKKYGYFEKALKIFKKLQSVFEEIECLISLKRKDEAVILIKNELTKFEKNCNFDQKVLYYEYCAKLGWLLEDPVWFDKAFEVFKSYEPWDHKGRYFFKKEDFKNSKIAYKKALEIAPQNEKILFAYASVKIKLGEYLECKDIFERLVEMDKRNPEYAKNLAICYYHEENIEKCMEILKNNALGDSSSMEFYFKLAIKNKQKNEILWCISRISDLRYIEPFIRFLVSEKFISKEEAVESKNKNPHLKNIEIKWD